MLIDRGRPLAHVVEIRKCLFVGEECPSDGIGD
jgi:hypothetical protein